MKRWRSEALDEDHDLREFESGQVALDGWLRDEARRAHVAGTARVTVWRSVDNPVVVAFHAVAPTQFKRRDLPPRSMSAGYSIVPGYVISRLAVDRSLHGQGLGTQLLLDALERIVDASDVAGGRLIAVDAIDEGAHAFYRHHDFQPVAGSSRLVMKIATARAALAR